MSFLDSFYLLGDCNVVLLVDRLRHVDHSIVHARIKTLEVFDDLL